MDTNTNYDLLTDEKLFEKWREEGDQVACNKLCERNWRKAFLIAFGKCHGNKQDAEDIVQDFFKKFLANPPGKIESFSSYLYTSIGNNLLSQKRKESKQQQNLQGVPQNAETYNPYDMPELSEQCRNVVKNNPLRIQAFQLLVEGYNYKEIAIILNKTPDQTRGYLYRSRQDIQKQLIKK